eukprot:TRINITY_DN1054_c0_g2_i1.p2 TRINITY_DN1054_c0_g2~~TRINITY_DN1054_c0_g2_i1.p2  ORF type:complete len:258 (+),score=42.82 TRINITY_DN1054_c0_g2_i1:134-907(+)
MSKTALVTGGVGGIGEQLCRKLYSLGVKLIIVDIDVVKGQALAKELEGSIFKEADVSKMEDWNVLVKEFERIDYLFLNAGVLSEPNIPLYEKEQKPLDLIMPISTVQRTMEVNFYQTVYGIGTVLPVMQAQGGGVIVVTASIAGLDAYETEPVYTATKHAVIGYMRSIKDQLNESNIKTYEICPGFVRTELLGKDKEQLPYEFLEPQFVAETMVDLATSEKPSQTITILPGRDPIVKEEKEFVKVQGQLEKPVENNQ